MTYTPAQVAELLHVSTDTVGRMRQELGGVLVSPSRRSKRPRYVFPRECVEAFLARRAAGEAPEKPARGRPVAQVGYVDNNGELRKF